MHQERALVKQQKSLSQQFLQNHPKSVCKTLPSSTLSGKLVSKSMQRHTRNK
jgi:hypothetical protein